MPPGRRQATEASGRVAADGVVGHREAFAAGEFGDARGHVLPPVVDRVAAALGSRQAPASPSPPTQPMTTAPRRASHWQSRSPVPPAAAWTSTASPGTHGLPLPCTRYSAVMPLSMAAAACSKEMASGSLTSASAATMPQPRVGARRGAGVGHAIALPEPPHRAAHRLHHAGALEADDAGKRRRGGRARRCAGRMSRKLSPTARCAIPAPGWRRDPARGCRRGGAPPARPARECARPAS